MDRQHYDEQCALGRMSNSNNSPPPLIVTMTSLGGLSPRSKRRGISQMSIELWHELWRAILLALTLYNLRFAHFYGGSEKTVQSLV